MTDLLVPLDVVPEACPACGRPVTVAESGAYCSDVYGLCSWRRLSSYVRVKYGRIGLVVRLESGGSEPWGEVATLHMLSREAAEQIRDELDAALRAGVGLEPAD